MEMKRMEIPVFNKSYRIFAYKICRRMGLFSIDFVVKQMKVVKPFLAEANLRMTEEEYFGTVMFTMMILFPFEIFGVFFLLSNLNFVLGAAGLLLSFLVAMIFSAALFGMFLVYPAYMRDEIKRNIESNIAYSSMHMATIAGTGVPTYQIFEMMADFPEYGQISAECKRISRNIKFFGYDLLTTLSETAAKTPSPSFKDLLWGMVSIMRTGGDIRAFLVEKARQYLEKQKNTEKEYLETLSIMAEMYITRFWK
jgi:archaellum biogenesis protein FlaJ (TadC family)